jgi:hypothetical protein
MQLYYSLKMIFTKYGRDRYNGRVTKLVNTQSLLLPVSPFWVKPYMFFYKII